MVLNSDHLMVILKVIVSYIQDNVNFRISPPLVLCIGRQFDGSNHRKWIYEITGKIDI